jgi:[ribosomal protein S5]-alanine N-acetyltransferase
MPTPQPSLTTARLLLRPLTPEDAGEVTRLAGEREIAATTLSIPHPYPPGAASRWITEQEMQRGRGEAINWAIVPRESGQIAGVVGLRLNPDHRQAELGYWIGKPYWGKGYATEAAAEAVRFGFANLNLHRIHARHFANNPASRRVLQKIGMSHEGCRRHDVLKWGSFEDIELYGVLSPA